MAHEALYLLGALVLPLSDLTLAPSPSLVLFAAIPATDGRGICLVSTPEEKRTGRGTMIKKWTFHFDRIFWEEDSQEVVFSEISQLVQRCVFCI